MGEWVGDKKMTVPVGPEEYLSKLDEKYSSRFSKNKILLEKDILEIEQKLKELLKEKEDIKLEIVDIQTTISGLTRDTSESPKELGMLKSNLYIHLSNLKNVSTSIDKNWADLYTLKFKYRKEFNDMTTNHIKLSEIYVPKIKIEEEDDGGKSKISTDLINQIKQIQKNNG